LYAPRIDLGIAISSTVIASVVGILVGAVGGYFIGGGGVAGLLAESVMRAVDVVQAFPVFIFALALVAVLGPRATNIIMAMVFVNTPVFIWLTRSEVAHVRQQPFVEAARCSGNGELRIALVHVLPNSLAPALTQLSIVMGFAVMLTAGISFVGAGIQVPTPEWGLMVSQGASTMITGQWWVALFPGLALASTVFGFALVGDGFRNYIDPKRRIAGVGPGAAAIAPPPV
jgi:peptide/nickel transport system permease protein